MYNLEFRTIHNVFSEPQDILELQALMSLADEEVLQMARAHLGDDLFGFLHSDPRVRDYTFGMGIFPDYQQESTPGLLVNTETHAFMFSGILRGLASYTAAFGVNGIPINKDMFDTRPTTTMEELIAIKQFVIDLFRNIHPSAHILAQPLGKARARLFSDTIKKADDLRANRAREMSLIEGSEVVHRPIELMVIDKLKTS